MKRTKFSRLCALLLALALCLPLPALAEGEADPVVTVDKERTLILGKDETLEAVITPKPAAAADIEWEWTSLNEDRLVLLNADTEKVTLRPVSAGDVLVRVSATIDGGTPIEGICSIQVEYPPATAIVVVPKELVLDKDGPSRAVTASLAPSTADQEAVEWTFESTDGREILKMDATKGSKITLSGIRAGKGTLTATAGPSSAPQVDMCAVTVRGVALDQNEITLVVDGEIDLHAQKFGAIGDVVEWTSGVPTTAMVDSNGRVTALRVGTTQITATVNGFSDTCTVNVIENKANTITGTVTAGSAFSLGGLLGDLEECSQEMLGTALDRLTNLSVAPAQGTLYYNYVSSENHGFGVGSLETYYVEAAYGRRQIKDVCFVPNPTFSGTAEIRYNGVNAGGQFFTGAIRLKVEGMGDVTYSVKTGEPVTFNGSDFAAFCQARTGNSLSYVTFTQPDSTKGALYDNYATAGVYAPKVGTSRYYVTGSPGINRVTFLPAAGFSGKVVIPYQGMNSTGATVSGQVTITVSGAGSALAADIKYTARPRGTVALKTADFTDLCTSRTGQNLDYVRFTLPAASEGTLIYDLSDENTPVTADGRYYRAGSGKTLLSKVSFTAAAGASGDVTIPFTAYTTGGQSILGSLRITIQGEAGEGEVAYRSQGGQPVTFEAADFNEACLAANGQPLDYIQFTLPDDADGTLYLNYSEKTGKGAAVKKTTKYTRTGTNSISRVTFVPEYTAASQVRIPFTGADAAGDPFYGTVSISIQGGGELRYTAYSGRARTLSASDFNAVCRAVTGSDLDYVRFTLPEAGQGTLYHRYQSAQSVGTKVTASDSYYRTGGSLSLDQVAFVPAQRYTGEVTLRYTGWSTGGVRFFGTVEITVYQPQVETIGYAGDVQPVSLLASDFRRVCTNYLGTTLSRIRFTTLPAAAAGQLRLNYQSPAQPGTAVAAGQDLYDGSGLDQLRFLPAAGYSGRVSLAYLAVDTAGAQYGGTVEIALVPSAAPSVFTDLGGYAWAAPSVAFLYRSDVVQGAGNGEYNPGQSIRRGDFALMVCRAFGITPSGTSSFSDVPAGSYYAGAVAAAQRLGVVAGTGDGKFAPNASLSRQDAMVMIQRAMTATGRSLPAGGSLAAFQDQAQVAGYARSAVAALVQLGAVQGSGGKLQPASSISRAEMAVILHRVLTLT